MDNHVNENLGVFFNRLELFDLVQQSSVLHLRRCDHFVLVLLSILSFAQTVVLVELVVLDRGEKLSDFGFRGLFEVQFESCQVIQRDPLTCHEDGRLDNNASIQSETVHKAREGVLQQTFCSLLVSAETDSQLESLR